MIHDQPPPEPPSAVAVFRPLLTWVLPAIKGLAPRPQAVVIDAEQPELRLRAGAVFVSGNARDRLFERC